MIIVLALSSVDPEKQDAFIEAIKTSGAVESVRSEVGNVSYDLVSVVDEPGKMLMVERWVDMASLKAHSTGTHFLTIGKICAEYGVKSDLKLFNAEPLN
ncbi:MAG: antibiotic biosynthesis monooxygenase family protein [Candidatus Scatomorpha sp.]|jgi:quinol monooxygenase YgiN